MASPTSFAEEALVDPQVQKSTPEESAGNAAQMTTDTIKKKKKKLIQVPERDVNFVLSYKPDDTTNLEVPELIIRSDPMLAASMYAMMADMALYEECTKGRMLEKQRNFRQQLRTQGRVTYEVEVDDDGDDKINGETVIGSSGGKGRRRHRPGVVKKQDGDTRKLN